MLYQKASSLHLFIYLFNKHLLRTALPCDKHWVPPMRTVTMRASSSLTQRCLCWKKYEAEDTEDRQVLNQLSITCPQITDLPSGPGAQAFQAQCLSPVCLLVCAEPATDGWAQSRTQASQAQRHFSSKSSCPEAPGRPKPCLSLLNTDNSVFSLSASPTQAPEIFVGFCWT